MIGFIRLINLETSSLQSMNSQFEYSYWVLFLNIYGSNALSFCPDYYTCNFFLLLEKQESCN